MPTDITAEDTTQTQQPTQQPQQSNSQEATQDAPVVQDKYQGLLDKYGLLLMDMIQKKRANWEWKRRGIVLKILKNKEMLKGNHQIGFYPGTFDAFDAFDEYYNFTGADPKKDDRTMDRRPHNFYQMLEKAFVAALSSAAPKVRWMPANADDKDDRETAKVASRVEEIIERANKIKKMVKRELMELFTAGGYFKYTRYVVDSRRTGTHKETQYAQGMDTVLPARYVCFNCGATTPEDNLVTQKSLTCPQCGSQLGEENYFEDHASDMPQATPKDDVPNGMVLQNIYSGMHVDTDPDAPDLLNCGLLNVAEEVNLGWLRTAFPQLWKKFSEGMSAGNTSESIERQYRNMLTTPAGYSLWLNSSSQTKPTYNRCWIQPETFAEMESEEIAKELQKELPDGCMLAFVAELPLQIRPAKLTDEWTWCGADDGFGLFPPPVGDAAVPVQERLNDAINKIDEYMDRLACGILLANAKMVDTKAMNGKQMLPGMLTPVAMKTGAPAADIQHAIMQVRAEIDAQIFNYAASLKADMELLVGTPPQTFGAGTQSDVDTFRGQKLQHDTGMMKMGLSWDMLREEHAEAAENAVKCASKNMTEDWQDSVADESSEYVNEYVHMDQMKGSVRAEPDSDQSFPMTYGEIKSFYQDLIANAENELTQWLMSEPENVDNAMRYIGVPGLKAPGADMRSKMLRIIDLLLKGQPQPVPDPITGKMINIPSVRPNKYLDDLGASQKIIENWTQAHWDKVENNKPALDNLVAYYKMCVVMQKELDAEKQLSGAQPPMPNKAKPKARPQLKA